MTTREAFRAAKIHKRIRLERYLMNRSLFGTKFVILICQCFGGGIDFESLKYPRHDV